MDAGLFEKLKGPAIFCAHDAWVSAMPAVPRQSLKADCWLSTFVDVHRLNLEISNCLESGAVPSPDPIPA